jgi:hypothetical protein
MPVATGEARLYDPKAPNMVPMTEMPIKKELDDVRSQLVEIKKSIKDGERTYAAAMDEAMKKAVAQLQTPSNPQTRPCDTNRMNNMGGANRENCQCFYCSKYGHMRNDCPDRERHLKEGITAFNTEGKLTMGDGSPIPRQGHPVLKDRIEERHNQIAKKAMMHEIVFDEPEPYQPSQNYEMYRQPAAGQYVNRVQQQPVVYPQYVQGYHSQQMMPQTYVQPQYQAPNVQHQAAVMASQNNENNRLAKLENLVANLQSQLVSTRGGAETNSNPTPTNPSF